MGNKDSIKPIMPQLHSKNIIYISYTGLLEPLGQSQVYRYLTKLASKHEITLITYEKPKHLANSERFKSLREQVEAVGIDWYPLRYHQTPSLPATLWDLIKGFAICARMILRNDIDIIHTRSYVPSVLGLLCKRVFGTVFVFDMRGFWADERVDGDIWEKNSRLYRVAKWFERQFLNHADVTVSLTEAGIHAIKQFDYIDSSNTQFRMIPTCVDLELFTPKPDRENEKFVLGYVGSAGTWYRFDDVLECFEILKKQRPESQLLILNQGDHEYICERLTVSDINRSDVTIKAVNHDEVSTEMNRMNAGIFFYTSTFSKKGTSPTKMGEFLACGLPCLSNAAVGDVEQILEGEGVGIALNSFDTDAKRDAVKRLVELSTDTATASRCREVAESYYSLERGVREYDEVYRTVTESE